MFARMLLVAGAVFATALPAQTRAPAASSRSVGLLASVDTTTLRGLRYRVVGPARGGRVTAVAGVTSQPQTFYMAPASGGVFKTTNNGATWLPVTDGQMTVASVGAIAVAESDPNVVYVGTGSDGLRSNVSTGRGVYKSIDAGKTWSFVGLYNAGNIGGLRVHPTDPNTAWVAAIGDVFKKNADRGIFKTTDGGKSWKKVLFLSDSVGASDIEVHATNPNIVYAWMARAERKPWTIISGAREGGFYKSTDGGETFTKITNGLPNDLVGKANLGVTAANPNRIFALVEAKPGGGFYRSDDAGQTWKQVSNIASMIYRPFYYTSLAADPTNADVVYAGAESYFKSTDGGATWTPFRTPHTDNHDHWISPRDGRIMIQSNDGGANISTDGGRTWSTQANQLTAEIYGVWMDDQFPYRIYGAQQDNSTVIIPSMPLPGATEPFDANGPGCETGPIMPHPKNPRIVYGACKGQFSRMDLETRQEQAYWVGGQSLYGNYGKDLIYRFQRVSPMEVSFRDTSVVYYGSQYVHRSKDGGVTWAKISPDLTAFPAHGQIQSGGPITLDGTGEETYSTLYAISESRIEPNVIWTGANDGPFYVTRDNGQSWKNITPKDLPEGGRVAWIDVSAHRRGSAYYAVYRYLLGDYAPYIYKTDDYGATWKRLTDGRNGIPIDWPTRVVREDPNREGLLYAGTEFGMFISFDNGAHWQPFNQNMGHVPINDIRIHEKDLIVATQGRAVWIMDDISPLHQIGAVAQNSSAKLYAPREAIRARLGGGRGGPAGGAPGQAQYPAYGANINYHLARAGDRVQIEIQDAAGKPVRAFSSESATGIADIPGPPTSMPDDEEAPRRGRGGSAPVRLSTNVGVNRLIWDFNNSNGAMVPPGAYRVKLTVGSTTETQSLTLKMDPRLASLGITAADLREQYEHNDKMRLMVDEARGVANRVNQARTRLRNAGGQADSLAKVQALAETLFGADEGVRYGRPGLQQQITYLAGMTTRVDQRIGRDVIERLAVLRKELEALKARVNQVLGGERVIP